MAKKHKIKGSAFETLIQEQLMAGVPVRQIAEICKEKGFEVSYSTIASYGKELDLDMDNEPIEQIRFTGEKINHSELSQAEILTHAFSVELDRFCSEQLEFMEGNSVYPFASLKSVKALFDVLKGCGVPVTEEQAESLNQAFKNQLAILAHVQKNQRPTLSETTALKNIQAML